MNYLQSGQFHGHTNTTIHLENLTLTDTEYTQDKVDWHYHENAYFTFVLQGKVIEGNKKEKYTCTAGTLLFHNWQDAHFNIKPPGFTRGFHVELNQNWFSHFDIDIDNLQGSINIADVDIKFLFHQIFKESRINDDLSAPGIQELLIRTFNNLNREKITGHREQPSWVKKLSQLLNDELCANNSLENLSQQVDIHPVHLCRDFHKYFHCGLSEYIRKQKVDKSLTLLHKADLSLTSIAFECGFADQSHFTRSFKDIMLITPSRYRNLLFS